MTEGGREDTVRHAYDSVADADGGAAGEEAAVADLLGFVLAGRREHVADAFCAAQDSCVREAVSGVTGALATLGRALDPAAPSVAVRDRVLRSFAARGAARKAVLVIDMINDYLAPGGALEVPRARAVVPALRRRIDAARAAGVPVVYTVDRHAPDDTDLDVWGTHAVEGTAGCAVWSELAPAPTEAVVGHPTYSAFFASELESTLRRLGVDTLVLTGCLTELQMFATATDALQRGFAVEVPADCHAGATDAGEAIAVATMRFMRPYEPARRTLLSTIAAG